jgi:hypothetical protein
MKKLIIMTSVVAAFAAAAATTIATAGDDPPTATKGFAPGELAVVVPKQNNVGAAHQTSVSAFRAHIEAAGAAPDADWSTAKTFPIAGTKLNGWTFNSGSQDCLAVPDPVVEGYAVKCGDKSEVADGKIAFVFAPAVQTGEPNIAAVLSPTASDVSVSGSDQSTWKRSGNVTAGKVADDAVISAGPRRLTVTRDKATKLVPAER